MVTDDGDGLEKFFRCPLCKLPHEATTTTCPITGRPVPAPRQSRRARAATAVPDAALAPPAVAQGAAVPVGPGHLLDRKYLLGKRLGEGGMGVVYEATHVLLARPVAVKLLRTGAGFDASFESRFLKEGRNLASVAHPHVVNVFDFGVASGVQYLVMERLEGESLESRIEREGPLDLGAAFEIARQVLGGLAAAHALGIVHRDLKPGNVFLVQSEDDEAIHVKLIDFGISAQAAVAESEPRVAGSPSYLPPEQARGEPADVRADIYSFGATMYETLTGRPPLMVDGLANLLAAIQLEAPSPPSRWRPGLSPELDRMLLKTLAKRPEDRFSSAEEVLAQCIALEPRAAIAPRRYVLVADANPAGGEVCRRVAKALGRAVFVVRDGLDALEITKEKGLPELLVATLSLPRMDGLALLTELRKMPGSEAMRALVASRFPAIRASTWNSKDALGLSDVLPGFTDEAEVRRAMESALAGVTADPEPPAPSLRTMERRRLDKIKSLHLVSDAPPNDALQRFVLEVAEAFRVPIALVSLVLEDRQWFKSYVGLEGDVLTQRGTPIDWSFCAHVVEGGERLLVPDARIHPVFRDNPLVRGGIVGSYAGAPLITSTGEILGTLCVIDKGPMNITAAMLDALDALARRVAGTLELSADELTADDAEPWSVPVSSGRGIWDEETREAPPLPALHFEEDAPISSLRDSELSVTDADPSRAVILLDADRRVAAVSAGFGALFGVAPETVIGLLRNDLVRFLSSSFADPAAYLREILVLPKGPFAAHATLALRPVEGAGASAERASTVRWYAKPKRTADGIGHVEVYQRAPR